MANTAPRQLAPEEISLFLNQTSLILLSGIPLADGMEALAENYRGTRGEQAFGVLLQTLSDCGSLAEATRACGLFPEYMVAMIAIGEQAGALDKVLGSLADYYEREGRLRHAIKNAIVYPIALIAMMAIVILILVVKVLPIFSRVFASMGADMPASAVALMNFGMGAGNFVLIVSVVLILIVLSIVVLLRTGLKQKVSHMLNARLRILGALDKKRVAGRFAQVMAMMLGSGFPIGAAVSMTPALFDDSETKSRMDAIRDEVNAGAALPDTLDKAHLFPAVHMRMIRVGYMAGQTDRVMEKLANIYDEELNDGIAKLVATIEPTLVALLSVIIGAILLSVMLPLVGVMSSIM